MPFEIILDTYGTYLTRQWRSYDKLRLNLRRSLIARSIPSNVALDDLDTFRAQPP